jgi:hypothetical protein
MATAAIIEMVNNGKAPTHYGHSFCEVFMPPP